MVEMITPPATILLIGNESEIHRRLERLIAEHLKDWKLAVREETADALEFAAGHPLAGIVVDRGRPGKLPHAQVQ